MSPIQRIKRGFWNILYPVFPHVERIFLFAHKRKRQPFHIGWLAPGKTLTKMKDHLAQKYQFGNHFVAWEDAGQVLSWRKLEGFTYQYHLRIFEDGEIRGHYELTPEAAPVAHFFEKGEIARTRDFVLFLGPYLSKYRFIQHPPLKKALKNESEITFVPDSGK